MPESGSDIGAHPARILIVDDEPEPLRASARILRFAGYEVATARSGAEALEAIKGGGFDAILSDISMPGMSGIELLQYAHEYDADAPVILITGAPAVETAVQALDHGAYKYLVKPVDSSRLEEVVNKAVQMAQMARIRRLALEVAHATADPDLRPAYESALRGMWIAYQPIVSASDGTLYGHEALMRVSAPNIAHPGHMLDAAERLNELIGLGRHVRQLAVAPVMEVPEAGVLFVNLHPHELSDEQLADPDAALSQIAGRVVLEITERHSVSNLNDLRTTVARLRELGFRIAVDDLGAGYAGLTSFALLEPDIVKIDMSLVRDIDKVPVKQRLVRSITSLCLDMNIRVVGEGVETAPELETLRELGCDLVQGYLLARPDRPFPAINWPLS